MTAGWDSFNARDIGIPEFKRGPGTPQRIQLQEFASLNGVRAVDLGRSARRIEVGGYITAASQEEALTEEAYIQANLISLTGDLTHCSWDEVAAAYYYQTFSYCRMLNYALVGNWSYTSGQVSRSFFAMFEQDYW